MSTTTTTTTDHTLLLLLQHPSHQHPLKLRDLRNEKRTPYCCLCFRKISSAEAYTCQEGCDTEYYSYHRACAEAYTCQEGCDTEYYSYHRACAEAPPKIDYHPLHPDHPLTLNHGCPDFDCVACDEHLYSGHSSFRCDECEINLDIGCALSTLSDVGDSLGGKTPEQITLPLHPHTLTSFSTRHDFIWDSNCYICRGSIEGNGYMCLRSLCEFVIHKRCLQDLYYADGTKAPRVYHGHPLATFIGEEDTSSTRCACCGSDKSGEFIGCASCQVFYHRNCFQVPEVLRYPSHNPDHTLVLFAEFGTWRGCQSCSSSLKDEIYYCCTSCEFFVDVGCAFQVLAYFEEGMSAKIELSWHKHPLLLCHRPKSVWNRCSYCGDESIGPTYVCEEDCGFLLHKRCTEKESKIVHHPHHLDHPLTLCEKRDDDELIYVCNACRGIINGLKFSCERCLANLHVKCAARFPSHKHYLHEHKLLRFEELPHSACNRCGKTTDSPLFRCVTCDFNLHEECMELPQVVESKIHWHPLTLHGTFVEDDSGEYYCKHCEEKRDGRLGVYVCGQCKLSIPWIYHIECVLPEIGKVYEKKKSWLPPAVLKLSEQIADQREKLVEATRVLDELVEQHNKLLEVDSEDES